MEEESIPTSTTTTTTTLNDLPDHLLLHILSFLSTLETIPTSLISRKFRPFWSLLPSLDFSYSIFPPSDTPSETRQLFSEFIDRTLIFRPQTPLLKFRLEFIYNDRYRFHLDSWVHYAIKNLAQELDLDFFIYKDIITQFDDFETRSNYNFPFSVLKNSRVKVLKLCRCDLTLPVNMRLWMITSLVFDQIDLTDKMVSDLLIGCPNLEIFELDTCYGMENLKFCSAKLNELVLRDFYRNDPENSIEFDCPNLVSLTIDCFPVDKIIVKDLSSLVKFDVFIVHKRDAYYRDWEIAVRLLGQVPHIKLLIVQNWWLKLAPKDAFSTSFVLYNLNHLELSTGYTKYDLLGMANLLELSPNLETMILGYLYKIDEDESLSEELLNKPINLSMPSLKQVKLKEFTRSVDEVNFVALLYEQGVVLEKIVIVPVDDDSSYPPIVLNRKPRKVEVLEGSSP